MLQRFADEGFLVESGVDRIISECGLDTDAILEFARQRNEFVISRFLVEEYLKQKHELEKVQGSDGQLGMQMCIENAIEVRVQRPVFRPIASEYPSRVEHITKYDISGKSKCHGTVDNFVSLFNDRYKKISALLRMQPTQFPVTNLHGAKKGEKCRFIGMVRSKTATKNGHLIIEIEDESGVVKGFINSSKKELMALSGSVLLDEVLAFDGNYKDPFFFIDSITWPDIPVSKPKRLIEEDLSIAFLSDLHVGSKLFLESKFKHMLAWLKGDCADEREREIASTVKYLFIAGDMVDGIGIYPNQERELAIQDIYEQYSTLFNYLEQVPEYIDVIMIPGNHDAVRRGDPQPRIPDEFIPNKRSNYHFGASPSWFKVEGLNCLLYHGNSLDSMIANISGLSYNQPEKAQVEYLKRRHLSPLYGSNHIIPEEEDYLVIEEVPDVVHMGHVHKNGYYEYRNVLVLNSGTWQSRTEYQRMQGHIPSPAILPIYNLKRGWIRQIDFSGGIIE
ncbi:MAG: DNA-directed DNA polymerase II small subunit [Candidatus Micrarchaeota archaeon]|nr:DNA-directed DNA polymerase II small subunit [Candidatus Micrarchaeota archaeon]